MTTAKAPTLAETRKAFRVAVDTVGMPLEHRRVLLDAFNESLKPSAPKKRTRRQEQNQAIRDIQTLAEIMPGLLDEAIHVIKRNDFDSGQRHHEMGELGEMTGTPAPHYGDPTGEEACWGDMADRTTTIITAMCVALGQWRTMAESIHERSNTDVRVRAERIMPNCLACGDQCIERVVSGFDDKCYRRFVRLGRPDRNGFIQMVKNERLLQCSQSTDSAPDVPTSDVS